jgi:hypothetical protein
MVKLGQYEGEVGGGSATKRSITQRLRHKT